MTGLPFTAERLASFPVRGLLRVKSEAGNSGGKPSEHERTAMQTIINVQSSRIRMFIYFTELFLCSATIQAIRSPSPNPEISWIYAMGVVI